MDKSCVECGGSRFRLSRFRISDIPRLLAFRYPVRCLECKRRAYASVAWAIGNRRIRRGTRV
jgi:hypothetical protein